MTEHYQTENENLFLDPEEVAEFEDWDSKEEEATDATSTAVDVKPAKSQVICVASGKGGTGKTMVAANLAVSLAREGLKVLLIDADFSLANSHLILGLEPEYDVSSVFTGEKTVSEIIIPGPGGLRLVPGGSGFSELAMLGDEKFLQLIQGLKDLEEESDIILVDLPAGINPQVMCLLNAAHEIIVVTTPEVTSLVDAYALIKSLTRMTDKVSPQIIINRAKDKARAMVAFQKIFSVTNKHLNGKVSPKLLGWVPQNWYVLNSVAARKPLVLRHPQCFATACMEMIAAKVLRRHVKWLDQQAESLIYPSYFGKLEEIVYGR
ncbi:MAG: P-loop NTPase [Pseudomonadota bacterium]